MKANLPVYRRRNELWLVCALYSGLLCLVYGNVIFFGKSLVYSDNFNPLDYRVNSNDNGPNFVPPEQWTRKGLSFTANLHDPGGMYAQWEPDSVFFRRSLLAGEVPLWNPYAGGGTPFLANPISTPLFPPYLLVILLGGTSLQRNLYYLLVLFLAGASTFALLRRHGVGSPAAMAGGIAFMLSGALVSNVGSYVGHAAALSPVAMLAARWQFERPSWRRTGAVAVIFASIALCSYPPVLLGGLGLVALYAVAVSLFERGERSLAARRIFLFFAAALIGIGLVAFFYLPVLELVGSTPQFLAGYHGAGIIKLPWKCFPELISHVLIGGSEIFLKPPLDDPFYLHLPYVGAIVLFLAAASGPIDDRHGVVLFGVALSGALLIGMKLFGVPPIQWIARLPVLQNIHYAAYLGATLDFTLALLAGLGFERIVRGRVSIPQLLVAPLVPGTILFLLRRWAFQDGLVAGPATEIWERRYWSIFWILLTASLTALLSKRAKGFRLQLFAGLLLAMQAAEAFLNTDFPRQKRFDVWRHPVPFVQKLLDTGNQNRALSADSAMMADTNDAFGIASADSLNQFNPSRSFQIYKRYMNPTAGVFLREASLLPPEGVLDRAAVEHLICRSGTPFAHLVQTRGYESVFDDGFTLVYRRHSLPKYFFTSMYRVASSEEVLARIAEPVANREILLEDRPAWIAADSLPGQVRIRHSGMNSLELGVEAPRRGFLYASENSDRGWRAIVNGKPARIWSANYSFRAVEVPAGKSVVKFTYWSPGLTTGLWISALSGLVLLGLVSKKVSSSKPASDISVL